MKKGQKIIVIENKTFHCYNKGDVLRIVSKHNVRDSWYCKKRWFGALQVLTTDEFNCL